jgi:HEAT repeat protein
MDDREFKLKIQELESTDPDKVRNTVRTLGYSGDKRAIPILMEMLLRESNIRLKNSLALSLGDLQADEAVPILMSLVKAPENRNKRGSFLLRHTKTQLPGVFFRHC